MWIVLSTAQFGFARAVCICHSAVPDVRMGFVLLLLSRRPPHPCVAFIGECSSRRDARGGNAKRPDCYPIRATAVLYVASRARARGLAPCAAGLSTANVGHVRTISTAPTQNARKTDRQRGRTDAAGRGRFLRFLPTLQFEETRPLFSQAHGDISSVNKQMSHRRQTVTRRTRCTPAPSRGLSASFKL